MPVLPLLLASALAQQPVQPLPKAELPSAQRDWLQAALAAQQISRLEAPALGGGESERAALGELVVADARDQLKAIDPEAQLARLRALLPDDLALLELVASSRAG